MEGQRKDGWAVDQKTNLSLPLLAMEADTIINR